MPRRTQARKGKTTARDAKHDALEPPYSIPEPAYRAEPPGTPYQGAAPEPGYDKASGTYTPHPGLPPHDASQYTGRLRSTLMELMTIARAVNVEPFEVLCRFAAGDHVWLGYATPIKPDLRFRAAAEASEYLYPKRKAIEITGTLGGTLENYMGLSREERRGRIDKILAQLNIAGHLPPRKTPGEITLPAKEDKSDGA